MADPFASASTSMAVDEWSAIPSAHTQSSVDPFASSSSSSTVEDDAFTSTDSNRHTTTSIDDAFASVKEFQSLNNAKSHPYTARADSSTLESQQSNANLKSTAASTSSSLHSFVAGVMPELPFVPVVGPILPDSNEYVSRLEKKLLKLHSKPLEARQPQRQVAGSEFFVTTSSSTSASSSSFFPPARSGDRRHFSSATSSWLDDDDDDDGNKNSINEHKDSLDSKESGDGYHSSEDEYDSVGDPLARKIQWMEDQFALLDNFEQQLDEEHLAQMANDIRANSNDATKAVNSNPFSKLEDEEFDEPAAAAASSTTDSAATQQPRVIEIESSDADLSGAPRHVQSLDQPNALYPPSSGASVTSASSAGSIPTPPTTYLGYLSHRHLYYQSQLYMAQASEWLETRECAIM